MFIFTLVIQAVWSKTTPSDCCSWSPPIRLLHLTPSHQIAVLDNKCFNLQGVVLTFVFTNIFLEIGYPINFSHYCKYFRMLANRVFQVPLFLKFQDSDFLWSCVSTKFSFNIQVLFSLQTYAYIGSFHYPFSYMSQG